MPWSSAARPPPLGRGTHARTDGGTGLRLSWSPCMLMQLPAPPCLLACLACLFTYNPIYLKCGVPLPPPTHPPLPPPPPNNHHTQIFQAFWIPNSAWPLSLPRGLNFSEWQIGLLGLLVLLSSGPDFALPACRSLRCLPAGRRCLLSLPVRRPVGAALPACLFDLPACLPACLPALPCLPACRRYHPLPTNQPAPNPRQ